MAEQCRKTQRYRIVTGIVVVPVHPGCVRCQVKYRLSIPQTDLPVHYVCPACTEPGDRVCACELCTYIAAYPAEQVTAPCGCQFCLSNCAAGWSACRGCLCQDCAAAKQALALLTQLHPPGYAVWLAPNDTWPEGKVVEVRNG